MTKLHHEIKINAPLEKVWTVLADLEAVHHYSPVVTKARYIVILDPTGAALGLWQPKAGQ